MTWLCSFMTRIRHKNLWLITADIFAPHTSSCKSLSYKIKHAVLIKIYFGPFYNIIIMYASIRWQNQ